MSFWPPGPSVGQNAKSLPSKIFWGGTLGGSGRNRSHMAAKGSSQARLIGQKVQIGPETAPIFVVLAPIKYL